jgi:predicted nucleotidyltransferase
MDAIPTVDIDDKYLQRWRDRQNHQRRKNRQLATQARAECKKMIDVLVDEFGATKIILFGSLIQKRFHQDSDIDLAVEGIASDSFYLALAAVNRLSQRWVDLKPLEALDPYFYQRVIDTGEVLYARHQCGSGI